MTRNEPAADLRRGALDWTNPHFELRGAELSDLEQSRTEPPLEVERMP